MRFIHGNMIDNIPYHNRYCMKNLKVRMNDFDEK